MADRYWVGGPGTWNTSSTTKWSASAGLVLTGATCTATALTTTTSPALTVGMTVFAAAGTSLGTIVSGSGNAWVVSIGGTFTSQTMTAQTTGASVPTTADNVFFTAGSGTGTLTLSGALNCLSLDSTGSSALTIGLATSLNCAGSFTISANTTWTGPGDITFSSTVTGRTITTNGNNLNSSGVIFNGVGGGWTLGGALNCNGLTLTAGSFSSNGYTLLTSCNISGSTTRTFDITNSAVTSNSWVATTTTNLTFINTGSTISITVVGTFSGGGLTYNNVIGVGASSTNGFPISGANTFNNLTVLPPATPGSVIVTFDANQTITGTLTLTGGTVINRILLRSESTTIGTNRTITAAAVSMNYVDFQNIIAAGTATWTGTSIGDATSNSGITFDSPKTVYWNLAGAQVWSATGWATSSGGTPALNNFPLPQDTAVFDNTGSVTGTITISTASFSYPAIDMSNRTSAMTLATSTTAFSVYGNWLNGTGITLTGTGTITFGAQGLTKTITSNGVAFTQSISINATSGTVQLVDNFTSAATSLLTLRAGIFNANNRDVSVGRVALGTTTKTLTMGSGTWTLSGTGTVWDLTTNNAGLTFSGASAPIILSANGTAARTFQAGGAYTYNKLTIGGTGTSTLTLNNQNNNISFTEIASTKTVAHTISFGNTGITTFGTWSVTGTAGNVVTVNSSIVGTARAVAITNKTSGIDYLSITDITSQNTTPVTFWAGANSTNNINNKGIAFASGATTAAYILETVGAGSFTKPANWNNAANFIYLIGGGGGGGGSSASGNNRAAGGGGGGGGYRLLTNQTLGTTTTYTVGAGGTGGSAGTGVTVTAGTGGTTIWDTTNTATGGTGGSSTATSPASAGGSGGTGTTTGGTGGAGATSGIAGTGDGGGGGGGAAGPNGVGGNGGTGFASTVTANIAAGGGGGNGGGSAGGNASSGLSGAGGNNSSGSGGGAAVSNAAGNDGARGGGGSGAGGTNLGGQGSMGADILGGFGSGGGNGGGGAQIASLGYGGGGGGRAVTISGVTGAGQAGSQGAIIIVYTPAVVVYTDSITENASLADIINALGIFASAATEASTLADLESTQAIFASSTTETSTLADTESALAIFTRDNTEASTLADSESAQLFFNAAATEASTLADSESVQVNFNSATTETSTLANTQLVQAIFASATTEGLILADLTTAIFVVIAGITENITLANIQANINVFNSAITENSALTNFSEVIALLNSAITEDTTLADSSTCTAIFQSDVSENVNAADVASASAIFASFIRENMVMLDQLIGYGWFKVVNSQTITWTGINNAQSVTWTNVGNAQNPSWVQINNKQP